MTSIRRARETDLSQMYEVFYQNEVLDTPHPSFFDARCYIASGGDLF